MRSLIFGLCLLIYGPVLGAEEPYGWGYCTDPEGGGGLNRCISHVNADCAAAADRTECLRAHDDAWFAYDANATLADAMREDAPSGSLSLKNLSDAIDRSSPSRFTCAETDPECLLGETIKRALGNHALRLHRDTE